MIRILFILFIVLPSLNAQSAHKHLLTGDSDYMNENYSEAELNYRKAREKNSDLKANYNLANATYKQDRFDESIEHYKSALNACHTNEETSQVYYNMGNAYFNNQNLEEAANAYKQAIKADPSNQEAQYNLALSKQMLRQMQQQQQQQQQQNQNQDNQQNEDQNSDQEEQQEQQENENQQQNQEEQQDSEQEEQQDEQEQQEQDIQSSSFDSTRLEKQELDSIDAAKLLQIIQSEEMKVQERLRKFNSKRKKPEKDW